MNAISIYRYFALFVAEGAENSFLLILQSYVRNDRGDCYKCYQQLVQKWREEISIFSYFRQRCRACNIEK